jgi:uncharacterized protein YjeT (DUF2065 family)
MDFGQEPLDADAPHNDTQQKVLLPHRRVPAAGLALAACLVLVLAGLGYLISRQGWSATAAQAHEVAAAVRRTTTVVRETSTDAATTAKVKTALALSKRASAFDVSVDTKEAITSLTGTVPSFADREHIGQIAAHLGGSRATESPPY